jgi:hypothetical protein
MMNLYTCRTIIILACVSCFFTATGNDFLYEKTKTITHEFKVTPSTYVELSNKYGNMTIETWDADSVKIVVDVEVRADEDDDLDELLGMIDVNVTQSSGFVIAETEWSDNAKFLKKLGFDISQNLGSGNKIQVDYTVYMPAELGLDIKNRFGDIFIAKYMGELEVEMAHGNFRAHKLQRVKSIEAKYGKLRISELSTGRFDLSYMDSAEIGQAEDLYIKSTSSEIEIDRVDVIQINSRNDEIVIEEVGQITGQSALSDVEIRLLMVSIDLNSKLGELRIREVGEEVELLNLNGNSTDYQIDFSPFFAGGFEVEVSENKEFSFYKPDIKVEKNDSYDKKLFYAGSIGTSSTVKAKVYTKGGYVRFGM